MGKGIKEEARAQELEPRLAQRTDPPARPRSIETAVHEELRAALGTSPYERRDVRRGYRNGVRERTLTGPTGPVVLTLPRATLFSGAGDMKEWTSRIRDDFHRIVYAANADTARTAYAAFERTWNKRCPGVVTSLREGGDELLTFSRFPNTQWKTLRTTNTIARLHEELRRRVKTQGSLPTEDAALVLLFSLVASGPIKLRKIDGWQKIGAVLNQHTAVAA